MNRAGFVVIIILGVSACTAVNTADPPTEDPVVAAQTPEPTAEESINPTPTEELTSISFEKSAQTFPAIPTWKIGLADLDGDDDLDAVLANSQSNISQVWWNDGAGFFIDSGQNFGRHGHGVDIGDLDGDGDPDMILTTHEFAPTRVYLNDGEGTFYELVNAFEETIGHSVDLYDLDGDGDLDAVGDSGDGGINLFWNDGSGKFTNSGLNFPRMAVWGDLDQDEDIDLLIKENELGYTAYLNDGHGDFSLHWHLDDPDVIDSGNMALGDLDQDGDLDAIVTNGFHRTASYPGRIFLNDGSGRFTDSGQRLSAVVNAGVSLGDLDNDGDLDLVMTDHLNLCQIWLNIGNGIFEDSGFGFGGDQFYSHALLGDLDGDGDLDIFLSAFGMDQGPNEIWFNQLLVEPGTTP